MTEYRTSEIRNPKSKIRSPKQCRVVILQPGFIPWLGFFELMYKCDIFVFLDDVQYTKRDWRSRNKIKTPAGPGWLTLPVKTKSRFTQLIKDAELDNSQNWAKKHLKTIKMDYSRAPYFKMLYPKIEEIYNCSWNLLHDIDIALIKLLMKELGLERKLLQSSEMQIPVKKIAKERIIAMCKAVEATHFYNGATGRTIYDYKYFEEHNIVLEFQEYQHPVYQQLWGNFAPYLSVIDLIFNHGPKSLDILLHKSV